MRFPKSIRLAPAAYANPETVFHVVIRTHPEVGEMALPVRDAVWASVMEQRDGTRISLIAACLMPDHLHLLIRPGPLAVIEFLDRWKSWTTRLAWGVGHRGPLWQPKAWDRAIRNQDEFANALEYIVRNPAASGVVAADEDWPHTFVAELE